MTAAIGRDGRARKVPDIDTEIDLKPLDIPEEFIEAVEEMRKAGYSEDEIRRELAAVNEPVQQTSRIPNMGMYPTPPAPLSQQTMDRLHGEASREFNQRPTTWINTGKAVLQNQFLQTNRQDEMEIVKDSHVANLLSSKGGFSAGDQIVDVLFGKRLLKKSRVDNGVPNERAWTVGQFTLGKQVFEEAPERPKESKGFIRGLISR